MCSLLLACCYLVAHIVGDVDALLLCPSLRSGSCILLSSQPALIPQLLEEELQTGNILTMGTAQLGIFIGPVVARGLIALLDTGSVQGAAGTSHTLGIAIAFGVDALSFHVSLVTLWMKRIKTATEADEKEKNHET